MVVESASGKHHAIAGNATTLAVIQTTAGKRQARIAQNLPAPVGDCARCADRCRTGTGRAATVITQRRCTHIQSAITAQCALVIVQRAADGQAQTVFAVDTTVASIGQLPQIQLYTLLSGNRAVLVVQVVRGQLQRAAGQQTAFFAVVELADGRGQAAEAGDFRAAVVHACRVEQQIAVGADEPQLVEQRPGNTGRQCAAAEQLALLAIVQRTRSDGHSAIAADQPALAVEHLRRVDINSAALAQNPA
ncbi:Unknown protein sequence [Pseudomonas syringae pv. aceris]|nr:Unknown protein sequence [Pseudomonas syringae pv. aceris]